MRLIQADLFSKSILNISDGILIPTNGIIKADRTAVMGAGVAKLAMQKWPELPKLLGKLIDANGNIVQIITTVSHLKIISFPTKYHWKEGSSLYLIKQSATEVNKLIKETEIFHLPRVGCGLGGLSWSSDVCPLLSLLLDDRFVVCAP